MASAAEMPSLFMTGATETSTSGILQRSPDIAAPAWQFEPAMAFNGQQLFRNYQWPLWNPFVGYGSPWAAGMLPQPFFPLSLLPAAFPSPGVLDWFLILRLFVAGVFAFLYLRLFVPFCPSVIGAITCMLTGYFVLYLNIDHLSTDVLLPAVFWSFERMYRNSAPKDAAPAVLVIFLSIVSGMPESTLLILSFGYIYYVFRVLTDRSSYSTPAIVRFVIANILGFALAAFLLIPLLEFLHNGVDVHRPSLIGGTPGLVGNFNYRSLLLYLLPLVFGPLNGQMFTTFARSGIYGYCGIAPAVLAGIAIISTLRRKTQLPVRDRYVILFFAVSTAACILKYWGSPVINWIGALPLFNLVHYPKYIQPLIGFSVACLAGFGAARALSGSALREVWIVTTGICATMLWLFWAYRIPEFSGKIETVHRTYLVFIAGVALVFVLNVVLTNINGISPARTRFLSVSLLAIVAGELAGNYILPVYSIFGRLAPESANPYNGAAYVKFLQAKAGDLYRIIGRDVLIPNWASAFGLYDVRYIYGITYKRYMRFVQTFLESEPFGATSDPELKRRLEDSGAIHSGELIDRFTGIRWKPLTFLSPLEQRYLQLSSVRYMVGGPPFASESPLISEALKQNMDRGMQTASSIRRTSMSLANESRDVLLQRLPSSRVRLTVTVPEKASTMIFSPAVDSGISSRCRDGVSFLVEAEAEPGRIQKLYERNFDIRGNAQLQSWVDERINLSAYAGQTISLLLSIGGGGAGEAGCDWAGWADLRFSAATPDVVEAPEGSSMFRLIYKGDVSIHEYAHSLPRASIFSAAMLVPTADAALAELKKPSLDIWRKVVVETEDVPVEIRSTLTNLAQRTGETAQPAKIESYAAQKVVIRAETATAGVLLLTDSYYPGWKAYVDGQPTELLKVNYLFRGVLLTPGAHRIEFRYAPVTYYAGSAISLISLFGALMWWRRQPSLAVTTEGRESLTS